MIMKPYSTKIKVRRKHKHKAQSRSDACCIVWSEQQLKAAHARCRCAEELNAQWRGQHREVCRRECDYRDRYRHMACTARQVRSSTPLASSVEDLSYHDLRGDELMDTIVRTMPKENSEPYLAHVECWRAATKLKSHSHHRRSRALPSVRGRDASPRERGTAN